MAGRRSLITRVGDWLLTLKRVAAAPKTEISKTEMPKPTPPKPAPSVAPMAGAADKRTVVYLASYRNETQARAGWRVLAKKSPILAGQQPILNHVDLDKKGKWVRLYGLAADEAERAALCKQLGALVDECGSRLRE